MGRPAAAGSPARKRGSADSADEASFSKIDAVWCASRRIEISGIPSTAGVPAELSAKGFVFSCSAASTGTSNSAALSSRAAGALAVGSAGRVSLSIDAHSSDRSTSGTSSLAGAEGSATAACCATTSATVGGSSGAAGCCGANSSSVKPAARWKRRRSSSKRSALRTSPRAVWICSSCAASSAVRRSSPAPRTKSSSFSRVGACFGARRKIASSKPMAFCVNP